jgi:signal transduction histidine kinase
LFDIQLIYVQYSRNFASMKIRINSVYILLVVSLVMVIVSAVITYHNTLEKKRSTASVIQTYQVIQSSTQLFSLLKDMETGQRGYIISGDSTFLEPYNEAKFDLEHEKDTLRNLIQRDKAQTLLLEGKVLVTVDNKFKDLEAGLRIFKEYGKDSASRRVGEKVGKAHMDTLRVLVQHLVQRERFLLAQQNETLEANTRMEDRIRFTAFILIGLTSLIALITIISKQRKNEELLEKLQQANEDLEQKVTDRTRQLVEANEAKDHFLGIASHDLKTPISGVQNLVGLMKLTGDRPVKEVEYLNYIEDSCTNMQQLISNLLDINRIERGSLLKKHNVEVGALLAKLEREFSHQAEKKNIGLTIDKVQQTLSTDAEVLFRILENLLSNAIKFSPVGKMVYLKTSTKDRTIGFEIIDEGPGIPEEDMPRLFGKFQKLTNRPTGGEGSTGLGLAIVKELTTQLGGEIRVTSSLGEGAIFMVIIPLE